MKAAKILFTTVLAILFSLVTTQCGGENFPSNSTPITQGDLPSAIQSSPDTIITNGTVVPARQVVLSFGLDGRVAEVAVEVGEDVQDGQVLARLDTIALEQAVAHAKASLALAQAQLALVQATPDEEAIAVAQASLAAAQAQLAQIQAVPDQDEIAIARANLSAAQVRLTQLTSPPCSQELNAAKGTVEKAEVALQLAQAEYDKVSWMEDVGASRQSVALQQATIDYEIAKANYDTLIAGASVEEITVAESQVVIAQARLRQARKSASKEEVEIAESQVVIAQAGLRRAQKGASTEEITVQKKEVELAQLALEQALASLASADLVAPFAGTVTDLMIHKGELASSGVPVVELIDTVRWQVQTSDVSELEISRVSLGQRAVITVNAFLDEELTGTVVSISATPLVQHGDTTYTVILELGPADVDLKWGMTARVKIFTGD
jgi:multidrug resistance efflux pump